MWTTVDSPIGQLRLVASDGALRRVDFEPFTVLPDTQMGTRVDDDALLRETAAQLSAYFAGELRTFHLPLAPEGTDYQQRVWQVLREIGWGETASYSEVAARLGQTPAASRAVGLANGRNPIPVIIGCHRVIGANGTLTGYAGGLERKRTLLALEGALTSSEPALF